MYICIYIYQFESHLMMCCIKQIFFQKHIYFVKYFPFFTEASVSVKKAKYFAKYMCFFLKIIYIYIYIYILF